MVLLVINEDAYFDHPSDVEKLERIEAFAECRTLVECRTPTF